MAALAVTQLIRPGLTEFGVALRTEVFLFLSLPSGVKHSRIISPLHMPYLIFHLRDTGLSFPSALMSSIETTVRKASCVPILSLLV